MQSNKKRWLWVLVLGLGSVQTTRAEPAGSTESLLAATCVLGGSYKGSLHAAVSYETLLEPPKHKAVQTYRCKAGPVAVYTYDYGTAAAAQPQSAFLGAKLWGGAAPTAEHSDELLVNAGTLIILSGAGQQQLVDVLVKQRGFVRYRGQESGDLPPSHFAQPNAAAAVLTGSEDAASVARAFAAAVQCAGGSSDPLRAFCPIAQLDQGTFAAPPGAQAYPGMSVAIPRGAAVRSQLLKNLGFSVLVLSDKLAFLQELTPDNAAERQALLGGLAAVSAALKSGQPVAALGPDLSEELGTLRAALPQRGHSLRREGKHVTYSSDTAASEIYLVSAVGARAYVVLERLADGLFVSIYPAPLGKNP